MAKIVIDEKGIQKLNELTGDFKHKTVLEISPLLKFLNDCLIEDEKESPEIDLKKIEPETKD
jgi:hypothetical protein